MNKVELKPDDYNVLKKALEKHYQLSATNIAKTHFIFENVLYVMVRE